MIGTAESNNGTIRMNAASMIFDNKKYLDPKVLLKSD